MGLQSLAELLESASGLVEGLAQRVCARAVLGGVEDVGQLLGQAFEESLQGLHVAQPLAFRAFAKALVPGFGLLLVQRFEEQVGPLEHPLPLYSIGPLVMLEPTRELAGR